MEINLKNKVVVITGAAGGLGSAIAKGFARDGAKVVCLDLKNTDKLKSEMISFGGTCYAREFDITDHLDVEENFKAIKREVGYIDVLINNAGINVGAAGRFGNPQKVAEMMDKNPVKLTPVITHRVKFENAVKVFENIADYKDKIKIMIDFD